MPDPKTVAEGRNARVGLVFFFVYLAVYAGFVGLCAFRRDILALTFGGLNLAMWYGFALILLAFLLALGYMRATKE